MDNQEERTDNLTPGGNDNAEAQGSSPSMSQHESARPASRIGFREFVPGGDQDTIDSNGKSESIDIPEFDLNQQMMAAQRRQASTKRRGPDRQMDKNEDKDVFDDPGPPDSTSDDRVRPHIEKTSIRTTQRKNPLIAEIVRRDIERLCKPRS